MTIKDYRLLQTVAVAKAKADENKEDWTSAVDAALKDLGVAVDERLTQERGEADPYLVVCLADGRDIILSGGEYVICDRD